MSVSREVHLVLHSLEELLCYLRARVVIDTLAANYGGLARSHWAVENGLHWHLDVTFRDDDCRARKKNAAQNLSLLRKLVLQIAKATDDKLSLRKRLVRASMDKEYLTTLLKNYGF